MKKSILAILALFVSVASAQVPSFTPNIGLQVPAYGQTNWQVPLNYNSYLLDRLLSGNAVLPGLSITGPAILPQLTTWQTISAYTAGNVVWYLGSPYSCISSCAAGVLPTNATFWSTTIGSGGGGLPSGSANLAVMTPNGAGGASALRAILAADLPVATNSALGIGRPDGSTIGAAGGVWTAKGGTQRAVFASTLSGVTGGQAIAPGSSAVGDTDSSTALNTALAAGGTRLILDTQVAASTSLVLYSGDSIDCLSKQNGVIMMVASNLPPIVNAHPNAPTSTTGTGGFTVSNQTDSNLAVTNCMINANSTQAVTGTQSGIAHKYNPATGLWVTGPQFIAVNGLIFENNEVYDAGTYGVMGSNDSNAYVNNNYVHFPTPIVHLKNTACIQFVGPDTLLWINNNRVQCGDDSIALNADDGNRTGSGDPNSPFGSWPGTKWGTINHVHMNGNIFDASFFGVRLLSAAELIDDISVNNTTGNLCGNTFTMQSAYSSIGNGQVGNVSVDGWDVPTTGTCNDFSQPYNWSITENYQNISLANIQLAPGINWPIITHNVVTPGTLSLRGWDINSPTLTGFNLVSFTGGSQPSTLANSIQWNDNVANTGTAFAGTATPGTLTCSNYAGPNRLLGGSFAPAISNGDCFTNTYPTVAVTYVNTTFSEASSGAVAGTTPATCTNGCTGAWAASSGGPSGTGILTYGTNLASITGICTAGGPDIYCPVTINPGHANFTMRANITAPTSASGGWGFVVRWTNNANFVTWINQAANQYALCDVVAGVTSCGSNQALTSSAGTYKVSITGTSTTLTNPAGASISGTISGSNTAGGAGINSNQTGGSPYPVTMTAFSLKSF